MPRMASNVDLPAPDGPMMETNSPGLMSNVMRRSTYSLPAGVSKTFSRSLRLISGTPGGGAVGGALSVELFVVLKPNIGVPSLVDSGAKQQLGVPFGTP